MAVIGRQKLIILFGLSPNSVHEAAELRRLGNQVQHIKNSKIADQAVLRGKPFNLQDPSDLDAFGSALGLAGPRADALASAIGSGARTSGTSLLSWRCSGPGRSDPMSSLGAWSSPVSTWWESSGGAITTACWDRSTSPLWPRCSRSRQARSRIYTSRLVTRRVTSTIGPRFFRISRRFWVTYLHTAPSISTGARMHLQMWERATRGPRERIDRLVAKDTNRGQNVVVWSRFYGLQTGVVESIDELRSRVASGATVFDSCFSGDQITTDHQAGPLRQYYVRFSRFCSTRSCLPAKGAASNDARP